MAGNRAERCGHGIKEQLEYRSRVKGSDALLTDRYVARKMAVLHTYFTQNYPNF